MTVPRFALACFIVSLVSLLSNTAGSERARSIPTWHPRHMRARFPPSTTAPHDPEDGEIQANSSRSVTSVRMRVPFKREGVPEVPVLRDQQARITFALFYTGTFSEMSMLSLEVVARHIIEHHPSRAYYPVLLLTDNVTHVPRIPPGVIVKRMNFTMSDHKSVRYWMRAQAERGLVADAVASNSSSHIIFLDATDILVLKPLQDLFETRLPVDVTFTYRQSKGGSAAARTMPVNMGIRVFHGASLAIGLQFFDAFMRTFWDLYLSQGNMYGLNEQLAMHDMLKRSLAYTRVNMRTKVGGMTLRVPIAYRPSALNQSRAPVSMLPKRWREMMQKPALVVNTTLLLPDAPPEEEDSDKLNQTDQLHETDRDREMANEQKYDVASALVRLVPARMYNCMNPTGRQSCGSRTRVWHFKGAQKALMRKAVIKLQSKQKLRVHACIRKGVGGEEEEDPFWLSMCETPHSVFAAMLVNGSAADYGTAHCTRKTPVKREFAAMVLNGSA
eukprot:CAMPEP_0198227964 /NCGR_PEP_ID=MMETSP1445-20131203/111361_1 /TAXON_ID=36898 /ORGANISM="Pyramimonas sp., Strain CCMP2087" /LENGTH=500 /DNA_ID=CAMNT_0043908175 /DNA_START=59 /DNA_END=1558 /DNA_ORIENTATION=-